MIYSRRVVLAGMACGIVLTLLGGLDGEAGPKGERGDRGKGPQGRGLSAEARDTIHHLFSSHRSIARKVEVTDTGYRATTTSSDPEIEALLRTHLKQMKARLESGRAVRRWDPAFDEMMEHYADMRVHVRNVPGGVTVEVVGKTPEAIRVARNHAKVVSSFVKNGPAEAGKEHPRVVF